MSDYLSSVLDELVPTFADEDGNWGRVVADAGAVTPTTTAHPWLVDATASSAADRRRHRRWPARWLTRRRLVAIAVTALLAALLVTPALGIGDRLFGLFESDPGPPGGRTPVWSPDGRRVAFLSRRQRGMWDLYVMNADGSGQRRLMPDVSLTGLDWSPDGRKIAVASPGQGVAGFYVVNADGSGRRLMSRYGDGPAWSPDGRRIAFVGRWGIWVMSADGSGSRKLTPSTSHGTRLYWSPDGRRLAFLSGGKGNCDFCFHLYVMNADGSGLKDLTPSVGGGPGRSPANPAWSPDGRTIAFVRRDHWPIDGFTDAVHIVRSDGSGGRRLTWAPADYFAPAWSPDGRKLAFVTDRGGNSEVYVTNADGSKPRNLTRHPGYDGDPMWSPDGRRIAFVSNRDGVYGIYVMNADGSGQRRLTHRGS
jgi:Tol biopolymer transport system component